MLNQVSEQDEGQTSYTELSKTRETLMKSISNVPAVASFTDMV